MAQLGWVVFLFFVFGGGRGLKLSNVADLCTGQSLSDAEEFGKIETSDFLLSRVES